MGYSSSVVSRNFSGGSGDCSLLSAAASGADRSAASRKTFIIPTGANSREAPSTFGSPLTIRQAAARKRSWGLPPISAISTCPPSSWRMVALS